MTYFLRTKENNTIVDIDFFSNNDEDDVSSLVDIEEYTKILLSLPNKEKMLEFCVDMSTLQEIRVLWFERYIKLHENGLKDFVKQLMIATGEKWQLYFHED